jgi:hypothetical protein
LLRGLCTNAFDGPGVGCSKRLFLQLPNANESGGTICRFGRPELGPACGDEGPDAGSGRNGVPK